MRFVPFVFLGYCCGVLAIVADMHVNQLRILDSQSTVPEVMVIRLPGFAAGGRLIYASGATEAGARSDT